MVEWVTCTHCGIPDMPRKNGVTICLNDDCPSNAAESLYDKNVVITGTFNSGTQDHIYRILQQVGANRKLGVSNSTDYVVVGGRTAATRTGGYFYESEKERAAKRRNIPILTEDEFLAMAGV